ncbi:unnamed protein product [Discosporangium mesarthrocarpum]
MIQPPQVVGNLRIDMVADGPTRALQFTDARVDPLPAGTASGPRKAIGFGSVGSSSGFPGIGDTGVGGSRTQDLEGDMATLADQGLSLEAVVSLAGIGVSVLDSSPQELLYLTVGGITIQYARGGQGESLRSSIRKLQVDNQLVVTPYPALLYPIQEALPPPTPTSRSSAVNKGIAPFRRGLWNSAVGPGVGTQLTPLVSDLSVGADLHLELQTPCLELVVVREFGYAWVNFVRLASVRLAPLDINLDGALVEALIGLAARTASALEVNPLLAAGGAAGLAPDAIGPLTPMEDGPALPMHLDIPWPRTVGAMSSSWSQASAPPTTASALIGRGLGGKLYFEELVISPIRLHVSFVTSTTVGPRPDLQLLSMNSTDVAALEGGDGGAPLRAILRAMGATLSNIENAPLQLNALVLSHTFASPEELVVQLVAHYKGQALRQAYKIVGSSELLGNPVGLLQNIGAGVKDFLYEPVIGLSHSPWGFAFGVIKGTSSLVRRTLYSSVDTTSRIASSLSSGLEASGAVDVVVRGGQHLRPIGLLDGVMLGLAGAIREPVAGLEGAGLAGLARGAMTGWLGLGLRPMYGALMSTSQLCRMVSTYLDPRLDSDQKLGMVRARPPRFFHSREQLLSVYSREENIGEELLSRVHMGLLRSEGYVWHTALQDMLVLVTGRQLLMLHGRAGERSGRLGLNYCTVEWQVKFDLMVGLEVDDIEGEEEEEDWRRISSEIHHNHGNRGSNVPPERGRGRGRSRDRGGIEVSVYHVPDTRLRDTGASTPISGLLRGRDTVATLSFVRRVMGSLDRSQAFQLCRVLMKQVPHLATPDVIRMLDLDDSSWGCR